MIRISVELEDGVVFTVSAATPVAAPGVRDFPVEVKVRETLMGLVNALCSVMQVGPEREVMWFPGMADQIMLEHSGISDNVSSPSLEPPS